MKPHKHAELIKAWADGAEIEWKDREGIWRLFNCGGAWLDEVEYRIKPEPKPDFVKYLNPILNGDWREYATPMCSGSIKLIRDGETGELKSAEVLK